MTLEYGLLAGLLVVGVWPLLRVWRGGEVSTRLGTASIVSLWLVGVVLILTLVGNRGKDPIEVEREVTNRPRQLPVDGYVGSSACLSCHPHEHNTWDDSYHSKMTQIASPKSVIGDFDDVPLADEFNNIHLFREKDKFIVEIQTPDATFPGGVRRLRRPVVMTTGSHHMQAYWVAMRDDSRFLGQLPFVYLKEERRWIPSASSFLSDRPNHFETGRWNTTCIACHTTYGRFRPVDVGQGDKFELHDVDTQVAEFGISCESCHGPGEEHVRANQNPFRRYRHYLGSGSDPTIVLPTKLPHDRSSQVCGQCHGVFESYKSAMTLKQFWQGMTYRPGKNLSDSKIRFLVRGKLEEVPASEIDKPERGEHFFRSTFWNDGMVRVSGREFNGLFKSPCYERGKLSCFSCHKMHQAKDDPRPRKEWANDQLAIGMETNAACLQCHQQFSSAESLRAHTYHGVDSSGSNCYNCHMSYTTYGLLKAIRSHQIESPNVQTTLKTGRPNACNQCHLDQSLGWTAKHLEEWYDIPVPKLSQEDETISASVKMLLTGDAGQRGLMAWSFGWADAHRASGTGWLAPYLGQLLEDPYDAVRFIAHRSLTRLPGYQRFEYDFMTKQKGRAAAHGRVRLLWTPRPPRGPDPHRVLLTEKNELDRATFERLLKQRDDRSVFLLE